jgi:ATP-dependent protease ClpP protease subunit
MHKLFSFFFIFSLSLTSTVITYADDDMPTIVIGRGKIFTPVCDLTITGKIDDSVLQNAIQAIVSCSKEKGKLNILLSSTGGSSAAANMIYEQIRFFKMVDNTTITVVGSAQSAAVTVLLSAGKRYMTRSSRLYIHHVSANLKGEKITFQEVRDAYKGMQMDEEMNKRILVEASGGKITPEMADDFIQNAKVLTPPEALELGLIHGIIDTIDDVQ